MTQQLRHHPARAAGIIVIIPADVDLSAFNSVVIYCVLFSVVFSVAPLQTA